MNHFPLLTIAIPTYNRPDKIVSQVKSISSQIEEDVELLIIDNASDVPVDSLLKGVCGNNIRVVRNAFNIGADANIAKCFELCKTEWLWTLSDDDELSDNAVESVLSNIQAHQSSLFIGFNRTKEHLLKSFEDFCNESKEHYSFLFWMSICVYNVRLLKPYMHYYFSSISTMQPGVVLLIRALKENNNCSVYLSPSSIVRSGGKAISWNRETFIYSSLFFIDRLSNVDRILNRTIFTRVSQMCRLSIILMFNDDRHLFKALRLNWIIVKHRGFFNSLFIEGWQNILFILRLIAYKITGRGMNPGE